MKKKRLKYGNKKTEYDGMVFDSLLELRRWKVLKLMERAGEISNLERQVVFPLYVTCLESGKEIKVGYMKPDFMYTMKGIRVVEDTKSVITAKNSTYRLKKKMIEARHSLKIIEIYR